MQHAGGARGDGGGVVAQARAATASLHAEQLALRIRQQRVKQANGVGSAPDAGEYGVR